MAEGDTATEGMRYFGRTWQRDEGLPRGTITSISQTPDGYLWLGTWYGLIRFDGLNFTPFEDEVFPPFAQARTRVTYVDEQGRLWVGTGTAGIIRHNQGGFTVLDRQNGLPHPTINSLCEDADGNLWVATGDGIISRVSPDDTIHPLEPLLSESTGGEIELTRDFRGNLWFAQGESYGQLVEGSVTNRIRIPGGRVVILPSRSDGLWVTGGGQLSKQPAPDADQAGLSIDLPFESYQVRVLLEDRWDNLWIGTQARGLYRFNRGQFFRELDTTHWITALHEDREGNIWAGVEGNGLIRLRPTLFHTLDARKGLSRDQVLSVCEDRDGEIWLSPQGAGLQRWNSSGTLTQPPALRSISTTTLLPNPDGGVWVGTVNRGLYALDADGRQRARMLANFRDRQIRVLHQDAQGHLWVGCLPDGLARIAGDEITLPYFFREKGLPQHAIWAMDSSPDGNLWLGTIRGELWRYDGADFRAFTTADGLPGAAIGSLLVATNGDLWIGTLGGGLGRYRQGKFVFAGTRHGLVDDAISAIMDDGLGSLWLGSERGIFRAEKRQLDAFADGRSTRVECTFYGRDDGLANVECTVGHQPAAWRTRSGSLWFATASGAVSVDPGSLQINALPPPMVLEDIRVDGVSISNRPGLELTYGYRELEFDYTATSFAAPERVQFKYQLEGFDDDWVPGGKSRTAVYPRLDPGRYVFRFTASNPEGIWSDNPVSFPFEVTPAFWQRVWFRLAIVLAFAGVVAGLVRRRYVRKMRIKLGRLEQERAVEQERMRIAQDIHDDLGARLTQMAFLSEMTAGDLGGNTRAGERLDKIAQGSRAAIRSLEEIVWAVNPRRDTLQHLMDYLSHFADEFLRPAEIRFLQDLPLMIPDLPVSAKARHQLFLAFKEALNNILKHAQATEVSLRIAVTGAQLELILEDNGSGFAPAADQSTGNGLWNLQNRLETVGGHCRVDSVPGRGTRVSFTIRLSQSTPESDLKGAPSRSTVDPKGS